MEHGVSISNYRLEKHVKQHDFTAALVSCWHALSHMKAYKWHETAGIKSTNGGIGTNKGGFVAISSPQIM